MCHSVCQRCLVSPYSDWSCDCIIRADTHNCIKMLVTFLRKPPLLTRISMCIINTDQYVVSVIGENVERKHPPPPHPSSRITRNNEENQAFICTFVTTQQSFLIMHFCFHVPNYIIFNCFCVGAKISIQSSMIIFNNLK